MQRAGKAHELMHPLLVCALEIGLSLQGGAGGRSRRLPSLCYVKQLKLRCCASSSGARLTTSYFVSRVSCRKWNHGILTSMLG